MTQKIILTAIEPNPPESDYSNSGGFGSLSRLSQPLVFTKIVDYVPKTRILISKECAKSPITGNFSSHSMNASCRLS